MADETGDPHFSGPNAAALVLQAKLDALRDLADLRESHHREIRALNLALSEERDRRYAEVATEREKALKIKETADLAALGLAREIQTYKDEKANELRSQIESERGNYLTRDAFEAAFTPVSNYVVGQQGPRALTVGSVAGAIAAIAALIAIALGAIALTQL